ncbi:MAG: SMP-30/gluconolactonase/LRE family protein [Candidatus Latescibacter sp.]|nr:SMP-30/gluconolactonase/LRE family protein [Candidatus Latescibacter sp.]
MKKPKATPFTACLGLMVCLLAYTAAGNAQNQRTRSDMPNTGVSSNLEPGVVKKLKNLPETELAPGVKGRMYWGRGALVNWMTLAPGAQIPREILPGDRIMVVMKGSVEQFIDGAFVPMIAIEYQRMTPISGNRARNDFVYLAKGAPNALKAGTNGAEILEVYSTLRSDYLKKAGASNVIASSPEGKYSLAPSVRLGKVYNLHDVQFTQLGEGAYSRFIWGRGVQLGFLRMDAGSSMPLQKAPEEETMIVLRGTMDNKVANDARPMGKGDILLLPSGMANSGTVGEFGCDALEVFWPMRPDLDIRNKKLAAYRAIIPEGAEIELVVDGAKKGPGLLYCEGPTWIRGKLYFSSMGYDEKWTGDPAVSATVEMDPNGTYRYISRGIETNGTFPLHNGNLAVCDMYGHRVIEMSTKGEIMRTIADKWDGKRIDGPNDLCVDTKGGVYFTDPQILPPPYMQPGKSVFYVKPNGEVIRMVPPGVMEKPNGLTLSPDNKVLYVNNTHVNYMMAYDVNADGTLSNGRKFGNILVTPEIMDQKSINPQTDGLKTDEKGNVYITTIMGVQIFSPKGEFVGLIHYPLMPVNCCFGGDDGKTFYANCNDKVYRIRTNVKGAPYSLYTGK